MSARKPIVLGREKQLFVRDAVLDSSRGVKRALHALNRRPDNPLLQANRPWEGRGISLYGSVWREPETNLLRMWYRAGARNPLDPRSQSVVCLATSLDGLRWTKPDLCLYDYHGQKANNIVRVPHYDDPRVGYIFDSVSLIHDPADPDPLRRYKMMAFQKPDGYEYEEDTPLPSGQYAAFSPDGLHWTERPEAFFPMNRGFGDTMTLMLDARHRRYVCFMKIASHDYGRYERFTALPQYTRFDKFDCIPPGAPRAWNGREWVPHRGMRLRGMSVSDDFIHWSKPTVILGKDSEDPDELQFYNNNCFQYESMYLGFAHCYHPHSTGAIDMQLIWSPDGLDWRRAFDRTAVLASGRDLSDWDYGSHCMATNPPIRMGDQLHIYYASSWGRHPGGKKKMFSPAVSGQAIGLATLRVDGFVSLDGGNRTGRGVTLPLRLEHNALCVNADAAGGELRAQLLRRGRPISGFDFKSCEPLRLDATRHIIRFKGGPIPHSKTRVRVEFALKNASLYAFWTEPAAP